MRKATWRLTHGACGLALVLGLLTTEPLRAEDSTAQATKLFDEGKAALDAGRAAEACAKFAESQKLAPGVGTLANLARCHEQQGLLLEALDYWQQTQVLADCTKDPRRALAVERITTLAPRVPTLTIALAPTAPKALRVHATDVRSSETTALRPEQLGVPRRVNPGTQRVVVEAPGRQPRTYEIELVEGAREELEVDATAAPSGATGSADGDSNGGARPDAGESDGIAGWAVGGLVVGAIGIVGLGVGAVFAGIASSKNGDSNEVDAATGEAPCDANDYCNDTGLALRGDAIDAATTSTVLFVAGGVLTAGGLLMVILAPGGDEPAESAAAVPRWQVGLGPGQVALKGSF